MSSHLLVLFVLILKDGFITPSFALMNHTNNVAITMELVNRNSDIDITNIFSDCLTTVINFRGVDINFSILNFPVVLLRYFSLKNYLFLFPDELRPAHSNNFNEYISESAVSRIRN